MADSTDAAIVVSNLHKSFKLPHTVHTSLKGALIGLTRPRKKGYEKQHVLNDISFDIKKGEFFGIVGRNGSGKSTLLKLLAGIYTQDKGHIEVNGKLTPFIELGVGFNPELTGRENVFLNGALLGFNRKEMEAMYDDIVSFAELERFMDQKLKNYSSGMQVRLAFSIAIRARTEILVLDEVLAVGDANFQKKCFDYFYQLKKEKKTVVLVSHSMDSVVRFCDRALLLDKGKIALIGNPTKVSDEYAQQNMEQIYSQKPADKKDKAEGKGSDAKPARITGVSLLDKEGNELGSIVSGSAVSVKISYAVRKPVEELNLGLGLYSDSDYYVFGYNTQMDDFSVDQTAGSVVLRLDSLPLLHGKYYFNVICFGQDETIPFDYKPNALAFDVLSFGREAQYRGVVSFAHEWEA